MDYKKSKKKHKRRNKKSLKKKKTEIDKIKYDFEFLKNKYLKSKKSHKDKLEFDEYSTQLLLKLDNINDNKNMRKKTISYIIKELDTIG